MYVMQFEILQQEEVAIPSVVASQHDTVPGASKRLVSIRVSALNPAALSNVVSQLTGVVLAATAEDW